MRKADTSPARHEATCKICKHAQREEIEREFMGGHPSDGLPGEYSQSSHSVPARPCVQSV